MPRNYRLTGRLPGASRHSHEFIFILAKQAKDNHVSALDIIRRLLDYNQSVPTIYFPLVPEHFLVDSTKTETKEAMDDFIGAMANILEEANTKHHPRDRHRSAVHSARAPAG